MTEHHGRNPCFNRINFAILKSAFPDNEEEVAILVLIE